MIVYREGRPFVEWEENEPARGGTQRVSLTLDLYLHFVQQSKTLAGLRTLVFEYSERKKRARSAVAE